jgi:aspartyl-tRNA(Asn)/glutamyl-tRNA(Gln) amidotransferase subunit A
MKSARATAEEVRNRMLDPVQHVEATLLACEAANERLNALTIIGRDQALAAARALPSRLDAGEPLPLAGVPLVVKDNIWVDGWRISQGSKLFADHVAPRDAMAVARARKAGGIVVGIGACSEFAALGRTRTSLHGNTHHPADFELTPGGSSGGNAAALASGMAPLALGTDGGGSSRRPPAHCGIVGFKPSFGAVPHPYGFAEPFWWLSCISPMARDVADTALLFEVIAGADPTDPESRDIAPLPAQPPRAMRVAISPSLGLDVPVDTDVADAFSRAIDALVAKLSTTLLAHPDWPDADRRQQLSASQFAGLAELYGVRWRAEPELFDPDIGVQIERGLAMPATVLAGAMETSLLVRRTVATFFDDVDILLCPTTPCVAWPHARLGPETIGGKAADPRGHAVFTPLFNHAWTPAISIPCGRGRDGLPVGMQIVGRVGSDRAVLAFAAFAENVLAEADIWSIA